MTQIYHELRENNNIERWYYGHFHRSYFTVINETNFIGLGINELSSPI